MTGYTESVALGRERRAISTAGLVNYLKKWIAVLAVAGMWELSPRLGLVDATFLPPLSEVFTAWWQLIASGELAQHIVTSLARSLSGYLLALIYAIPLGIAIGWYKRFADVINPLLEILRNTAALALLPVFILLLGIGESSKIALIVYACSWPLLLNTISAVRYVDTLLIKSAQSMGLKPLALFRRVILPAAVPTIFVGIRLAGASSILVLVAAEMIGAKAGLGYLIIYAQYSFLIPQMYAGIITISAIGFLFNLLLVKLEKRFTAWKPSQRSE
jgi:NitT/TauT family transport system permease protein